jgi:HlyD family type I secretion membrane fusion protein
MADLPVPVAEAGLPAAVAANIRPAPPALPMAPPKPPLSRFITAGVLIIVLFFGGFGAWAGLAPLASSAVAQGSVRVEGNRKTLQHLEGGIIQELLVKEGDVVQRDQILIRLDRTVAQSRFETVRHQFDLLKASEARLLAEQARSDRLIFPQELEDRRDEPRIATLLGGQEQIFATRRQSYKGQNEILQARIDQLRSQIEGQRAQQLSSERQLELIRKEQATVADLVSKGLEREPRLLDLQRRAAALQGARAESQSEIARVQQTVGETELRILALDNEQAEKVAAELKDTQADLARAEEELGATADVLRRRELRAPLAGTVLNLKYFTAGGVIAPGTPIMDIVPNEDRLLIEAQLSPLDIDVVRPGLPAEIRLSAYKQRRMPILDGRLIQISADRLLNERDGAPYYKALIEVDAKELAELDGVELYPGMPADVMIKIGERTFFEYLTSPIHDSFSRAFHEQ